MEKNIFLNIDMYIPVILEMTLLFLLLYIPLPIVLWIYRRRKVKPGTEKETGHDEANPANDFKAEGKFQGFNITASGSVALYFILFVACLSSSIPIMKSIDHTQLDDDMINKLSFSRDSILSHSPWKLQYYIDLMKDSMNQVDEQVYADHINSNHFHPFPSPLILNEGSHLVSFYINEEEYNSKEENYRVNVDDFNAGFELQIKPESIDSVSRKIDLGHIKIIQVPESIAHYTNQHAFSQEQGLNISELPRNPKLSAKQ